MNNLCRFAATAAIVSFTAAGADLHRYRQSVRGPVRPAPRAGARRRPMPIRSDDGSERARRSAAPGRQLPRPARRPAPSSSIRRTPTSISCCRGGKAIRYGIGVGREGFTWSGVKTVERKAEWPDWTPPPEMIARQPYLPRFMAGGPANPLGARAMYLGGTVYRIHGTNAPVDHRPARVVGLHPPDQRGRDRPLQPRQGRHQGGGAADA